MPSPAQILEPLADARTVRLTTFRRDGRPVATPVSVAVDGDRAFVRTYESSGKVKRLRRDPHVDVAPSTFRGEALGTAIEVRARILDSAEAQRARRLIEAKHPVLHGLAVPIVHRLTGKRTVYLELRPCEACPASRTIAAEEGIDGAHLGRGEAEAGDRA